MGYAEDCQKSKKGKRGEFPGAIAGRVGDPAGALNERALQADARARPRFSPLRGDCGRSGLPGFSPDVHQGDGSAACRYPRKM